MNCQPITVNVMETLCCSALRLWPQIKVSDTFDLLVVLPLRFASPRLPNEIAAPAIIDKYLHRTLFDSGFRGILKPPLRIFKFDSPRTEHQTKSNSGIFIYRGWHRYYIFVFFVLRLDIVSTEPARLHLEL